MENKNQKTVSSGSAAYEAGFASKAYKPDVKHVYGFSKGLLFAILGLIVGLFFVFKDFDFEGGSRYSGQLRNMESAKFYTEDKGNNMPAPANPMTQDLTGTELEISTELSDTDVSFETTETTVEEAMPENEEVGVPRVTR